MYSISIEPESLMPRERLLLEGAETLSNQELLAILLRTGTKGQSVFSVANGILNSLESLHELKELSVQELQGLSGVGKVKAIEIKAMIELSKRINQSTYRQMEQILSSEKLAKQLMQHLSEKKQEHLLAIYLDTQNQIIKQETIFIGTVMKSIAEPREILHYAIKYMATSVIIVHNHPSGRAKPSPNDDQFTMAIKKASELLGLVLLDHLIIGSDEYYSYREETDLL
ncbi:RadC family protein [Streptococcus moroccensis]|uniref:DNA repair protein RadC n=1 Tax=Streptococcus moroccensis TaxID=1451356 RepID=A0ABT9YU92_9STRE|nr:DNA repair protein RadC [Streptococcus moroccensis]MDQ0223553.1 DNA repair protein RadC [Streptococcus moroccensis]